MRSSRLANLFVQSGINSFDAIMVSGNAAAANADNLIYNVMFAFYVACSSFMSQNWGAGNKERMKKCYFVALTYSFSAGRFSVDHSSSSDDHSCLCLLRSRPLLQLVCIESGLWDSPMHSVPLWTVQLPLPEESARALLLHLLLSWDPVYFVLYGSIRYLLTSIQFHLCICCTSSPGDSQRLQKPYTLKLVSKRCLHNRFPKVKKRDFTDIQHL